ncbi:MAG TPA: hypothetical protein VFV38_41790, partial [Ktedonobacteraceae bacterium]|nr:hypothetical protein [Ktedonobacteraceae bacterium]
AGPLTVACVLAAFLATNVGADTTPTTYYACVNMKTGSIYMVNAGDTCQKGYTPINWNQVGPQGPQGPQGSAGPAGPQGPQGQQGPAGPTQTLSVQTVNSGIVTVSPGEEVENRVFCPAGTVVSGGGFAVTGTRDNATWLVIHSEDFVASGSSLAGWEVDMEEPATDPLTALFEFEVYTLCLTLS